MLALDRRGLQTLLAQRTLRSLIPLVLAPVTILPLTGAMVTLAVRRTAAAAAAPASIAAGVAGFLGLPARSATDVQQGREAIADLLAARSGVAESPGLAATLVARYHSTLASPQLLFGLLDHFWFLWYVCLMVAVLTAAETAGLGPSGRHRWWLVPANCLPFTMMRWPFGPDTALGLVPPPHLSFFMPVASG